MGLRMNLNPEKVARMTRLELATPSVTGWCSNQLSYTPTKEMREYPLRILLQVEFFKKCPENVRALNSAVFTRGYLCVTAKKAPEFSGAFMRRV